MVLLLVFWWSSSWPKASLIWLVVAVYEAFVSGL